MVLVALRKLGGCSMGTGPRFLKLNPVLPQSRSLDFLDEILNADCYRSGASFVP